MMNKLKYREISEVRSQLLEKQRGCCALCGEEILEGEAVLDHDHGNGMIRGTLHRGCNLFLGKIERSLKINRITPDRLTVILSRLENYSKKHYAMIHPTYKERKRK